MNYTDIDYEVIGSVALLTLNRPEKLNAFTYHTLREIREAVEASVQNPEVVGIVITGKGRGFSSGLDSAVLASVTSGKTPATTEEASDELPGIFSYLLEVPKPVISAINGVAAGGAGSGAGSGSTRGGAARPALRPAADAAGWSAEDALRRQQARPAPSPMLSRHSSPTSRVLLTSSTEGTNADEDAPTGLTESEVGTLKEPAEEFVAQSTGVASEDGSDDNVFFPEIPPDPEPG